MQSTGEAPWIYCMYNVIDLSIKLYPIARTNGGENGVDKTYQANITPDPFTYAQVCNIAVSPLLVLCLCVRISIAAVVAL